MKRRVVFDTTTVLSALLFRNGRLAWLLQHWEMGECTPLISSATAGEIARVLGYPKFRLSPDEQREMLAHYLPFCEVVSQIESCPQLCRDMKDQPFLDLAHSGKAECLVSGDGDLQALAEETKFLIVAPETYRQKIRS